MLATLYVIRLAHELACYMHHRFPSMLRHLCFALVLTTYPLTAAGESKVFRIDDHVFRGKQPAKAEFATIAKMGIRTVLDLRGGPIHGPRERKIVEAAGMQYISIRLSGIFPPKDKQMARILAILQDPNCTPVFVHCRRGGDRVGTVIACYRMFHDHWTNAQAMAEARKYRISPLEVLMQRYVRHFDPSRIQLPTPADSSDTGSHCSSYDHSRPPSTYTVEPVM